MDEYRVRRYLRKGEILPRVPASKSILARALVLAALSSKEVLMNCGPLCGDSRSMAGALRSLGTHIEELPEGLLVRGTSRTLGRTGCPSADVGSAGTAARFLPAAVAFCRGKCDFVCSEQMAHRPMALLPLLREHGAVFEFRKEEFRFPFRMDASGFRGGEFGIDTTESTQYASALLLAASASDTETSVALTGSRTGGSYLMMTRAVLRSFGVKTEEKSGKILITPPLLPPERYDVEPDLSGACYFYALSLLFGEKVTVPGLHENTLQGDIRFLKLLSEKGVRVYDTPEGLCADGRNIPIYSGFDVDMRDFSDQALTVAVLALFASTPSILRGLGHTRAQESDRIEAIVKNVNVLGARAFSVGEDVFIEPAPLKGGTVTTFSDHRVAMAFSLAGLKTGNIVIDDASCCEKTFPNFFSLLNELTK